MCQSLVLYLNVLPAGWAKKGLWTDKQPLKRTHFNWVLHQSFFSFYWYNCGQGNSDFAMRKEWTQVYFTIKGNNCNKIHIQRLKCLYCTISRLSMGALWKPSRLASNVIFEQTLHYRPQHTQSPPLKDHFVSPPVSATITLPYWIIKYIQNSQDPQD